MRLKTFVLIHGTIAFIFLLIPHLLPIILNGVPDTYDQLFRFVTSILALVISAEMLIIGLSRLPLRRLGQFLRSIWALGLIPLGIYILTDTATIFALGSRLDYSTLAFVLANLLDFIPVITAELDITVILSLVIIITMNASLAINGWFITPRLRCSLPFIIAPLIFFTSVFTVGLLTPQTATGSSNSTNRHFPPELLLTNRQPNTNSLMSPPVLAATKDSQLYNIIIITLESTPADSTTPYNPTLNTTPFLNQLAQQGLIAQQAFPDYAYTSKSLVSIHCGIPPIPIRSVKENKPNAIPYPCLPKLLQPLGYRSAFFQSANGSFEKRHALIDNLGFQDFFALESLNPDGFEQVNYFGLEERAMTKPILDWIKQEPEPFLLSILSLSGHHPYRPPANFKQSIFAQDPKTNGHLNSINYVDGFMADLFDQLDQIGKLDNTLIIITGDHGATLDFRDHRGPFRENINIPLIVWNPRLINQPTTVLGPRQHSDIVPTIIDMLNFDVTSGKSYGQSLLKAAPGRAVHTNCKMNICLVRIIRNSKFIYYNDNKPVEVFDLDKDPDDKHNLAPNVPKHIIDRNIATLTSWRDHLLDFYRDP